MRCDDQSCWSAMHPDHHFPFFLYLAQSTFFFSSFTSNSHRWRFHCYIFCSVCGNQSVVWSKKYELFFAHLNRINSNRQEKMHTSFSKWETNAIIGRLLFSCCSNFWNASHFLQQLSNCHAPLSNNIIEFSNISCKQKIMAGSMEQIWLNRSVDASITMLPMLEFNHILFS